MSIPTDWQLETNYGRGYPTSSGGWGWIILIVVLYLIFCL